MTESPDALVAAVEPDLEPPAVQPRDVVLVVGPWLAGTTSVVSALRERMPEHTFVEKDELARGEAPAAVVFVVSAASVITESDCGLVDLATPYTDLVIGVVSKIDAHRDWRDVLAADRAVLAEREPHYAHVPWLGVSAAPDLGEPRVDELVVLLRERLADPGLEHRNRLRAWETRVQNEMDRYCADGDGAGRRGRVRALHQSRDDIVQDRRLMKSERTIALRSQIQQARVQLGYFARNRCTALRAELAESAAQLSRRRIGGFEAHVRQRAAAMVAEVEHAAADHLGGLARRLELPMPPAAPAFVAPAFGPPPLKSRRQETQLIMILGAGFGLGVALLVTRLFAGLGSGLTVAGLLAGGLVGLAMTVWVVGIRTVLHDRAVLDRWVGDVVTCLKSAVEERVATQVLATETALTSEAAARDAAESAAAEGRIGEIDAELREHAVQAARAATARDRRLPSLQQALDAVRAELYGDSSAGKSASAK